MGELVVTEFVSLDGVFEDPGGAEGTERGGWAFKFDRGEDGERFKTEELMAADVQLLGRVNYEGFAKAWPQMNRDDFGKKMNEMPKYVASTTLARADWDNSTIIRDDLASEVKKLKEQVSGDILVAGSGKLVTSLMLERLVDEYRLMVYPVVLGVGRRLFEGATAQAALRLVKSKAAGECLILVYRPTADGVAA